MKKRFDMRVKADLAREQEIRDFSRKYSRETQFSTKECESILKLHQNITSEANLDRMQFRSFLFSAFEISNTFLLDRIFRVCDRNDDGIVDGEEFLRCLSTMMRGKLQELIAFCYEVYDINGDRALDRDELIMAMECSIRPGRGIIDADEVEDSIKEVVEIAMRKLDVNWDGAITFDDFEAAVKADPLLLQVCGRCLPPVKYSRSIQSLFTLDYKKLTPHYIDNWAAREMGHKPSKTLTSRSRFDIHASRSRMTETTPSRIQVKNISANAQEKNLPKIVTGMPLANVKDFKVATTTFSTGNLAPITNSIFAGSSSTTIGLGAS